MSRIVLANVDYKRHMTSEGDQLQEGLRSAGWTLCGKGYDGSQDVQFILDKYNPDRIVVHDKRDWDPTSSIAFRKDVGFGRLEALRKSPAFKAVVVKDAASSLPYQKHFYDEVGADAAIVYYHPKQVATHSLWLTGRPMIRTYHSVAAADLDGLDLWAPRKRAVVSGAASNAYPLRQRVIRDAAMCGVDVLRHPGYGNVGTSTPAYLKTLAGYQVHVATASMYGFALRKIIESIAVGCTVVTDLPDFDVLPEIDGALIRVRPTMNPIEMRDVIRSAVALWNLDDRMAWAEKARRFYDYEAIGCLLSLELAKAAEAKRSSLAVSNSLISATGAA